MSVLNEKSVFTSLNQKGPLATPAVIDLNRPFHSPIRSWVRRLRQSELNVTKYRALRRQVFEFLDISSFQDIATLLSDSESRESSSRRACMLLGNMFGISGTELEIRSKVSDYGRTADSVIKSLQNRLFAPYSSHVAMTNEVEITSDPVDLLLMMFDDRYHKKARFEAHRKLSLMSLAGSIDQRERETSIEEKFSQFLTFLNNHVWSSNLKIGEHDIVYLLSQHEATDFRCTNLQVIRKEEAPDISLGKGMKLTLLKRRRFQAGNRELPIYVSIRKKPPEAKVLKLLRKNEKNPAVAVDDELGLMAVLDSAGDVKVFQNHLTQSASKADSFMILEDISDTLTGGIYASTATGSSTKTPMLKFFARLGGMRVEFIIHTNESWVNYLYQREVAHDEYEVKRIFDSGVAELLFPQEIYFLNHQTVRNNMIRLFRKQIEESWLWSKNGSG
jgi:5-methylcytosine-specific restriction endonuclease McrA